MYEEKRAFGKGARKWKTENEAVGHLLRTCPDHSQVVDIPVGTGRYAVYYGMQDMYLTGLDTSQDMMDIAAKSFADCGVPAEFRIHDILEPLPGEYDIAVCTRLVNHFTLEETKVAVKNLLAAAPVVILGLREPKEPTEKNWHNLADVIPPGTKVVERVVMSDGEKSRYIMAKIENVG